MFCNRKRQIQTNTPQITNMIIAGSTNLRFFFAKINVVIIKLLLNFVLKLQV